jgi:hypothetical protein
MKQFKHLIAAAAITSLLLSSCDKTVPVVIPPAGGISNTPNFICEHQPAASLLNGQFAIFDLNQEDNRNKQFFTVSLLQSGIDFLDSAAVLQTPKAIETLAPGWPVQLKSVAFGKTLSMQTDAKNAVVSNAGDAWKLSPINTSTNLYRKLNEPLYAGAMAGKKPAGNNSVKAEYKPSPDYSGDQIRYRDIVYYFKEGMYTNNVAGLPAAPLDSLFTGAAKIDWKTIDQVVKVDIDDPGKHIRYFSKYYFFDWTNWRYYVVYETEAIIPNFPPIYHIKFNIKGPLSLDKFCKWPAGWGKK